MRRLLLLLTPLLVFGLLAFGECGADDEMADDDDAAGATDDDDTPAKITRTGDKPKVAPPPPTPDDARWLAGLPPEHRVLVEQLADPSLAPAARELIVAQGPRIVPSLQDVALLASDPVMAGGAIQALGAIQHASADQTLRLIHDRTGATMLVRTWAAAARIQRATSIEELQELSSLTNQFPATGRTMTLQTTALLGDASVRDLIALARSNPAMQQSVAGAVVAKGPGPLIEVMFTDADTETRRLAASYLGGLATSDPTAIDAIVDAYAYVPGLSGVPWAGGALYVPSIGWQAEAAKAMVGHLIAWHVHCDRKGLSSEKQQIYNNLRSVGLHRPAGFPWPASDTKGLVDQYRQTYGDEAANLLLNGVDK